MWTGADAVVLANVRHIAAGRRGEFVDDAAVAAVRSAARPGLTFGQLEGSARVSPAECRPTRDQGVFSQILGAQGSVTAREIAADLHVPVQEVRALTFSVELGPAAVGVDAPAVNVTSTIGQPRLQLVQ